MRRRKSFSHWDLVSAPYWPSPATTSSTTIASSEYSANPPIVTEMHPWRSMTKIRRPHCANQVFLLSLKIRSMHYFSCFSCSDALLTSSINLATSLLAGFVIFAVLGYMAAIRHVSIDQLGLEGFFLF